MKSSLISEVLAKLAHRVGLIVVEKPAISFDTPFPERTAEDVKRALAAARRIRAQAREMKLGVTDDEILRWVKEGRR